MSKPRYIWWGYVKSMIRRYPELAKQYAELHTMSETASFSGIPSSSETSRTTETVAIRELPTTEQREYEAVRRAIELTEQCLTGRDRLRIIRMVLLDCTHTLEGAALTIPCSIATAKRWHGQFIRLVAKCFGLLDNDKKSTRAKKKV